MGYQIALNVWKQSCHQDY